MEENKNRKTQAVRKDDQPVTQQEKQEYQEYVKEMTPTHNLAMQMLNAFICGGII